MTRPAVPPPMIRWVYFGERKEVSSGWSSVLPMVAAKQACLGLLLFQFNPQLAKREEHEMAMASKEASNDWPFSQKLKGSIGKKYAHQQSLMRPTYPRA